MAATRLKKTIQARLLLLACCSALALHGGATAQEADWYPQEFFAETTTTMEDGETLTIRNYIGHLKIRSEWEADGDGAVVIMMLEGPDITTLILDPAERTYMEMPGGITGLLSAILPLDSTAHPCSSEWACKRIGTENVDGRRAEVWTVRMPDIGESTVWLDEELHFPLRTVGITPEGEEVTSEVTRLEVGPQPPELFTVPEGYEKEGF